MADPIMLDYFYGMEADQYTFYRIPKLLFSPAYKELSVAAKMLYTLMIGIPWMLAFALRADGWYLHSDIIWRKGNPMPESCKDAALPHRARDHRVRRTGESGDRADRKTGCGGDNDPAI